MPPLRDLMACSEMLYQRIFLQHIGKGDVLMLLSLLVTRLNSKLMQSQLLVRA